MSTITKEWLQQKIADMEATRDEIPFGMDEDDSNTLDAMKLALASLEAEAAITVGDDGGDALAYRRLIQTFAPGTKLYTAPPVPVSVMDEAQSRELFEKNCMANIERNKWHPDLYAHLPAREQWAAWEACRKAMLQGADGKHELTVWYGSMPESNGKANWTAILHRKGEGRCMDGFTIDHSEYPGRVLYAADRVRYLIGEKSERPSILDYDADAHSGYVKTGNSPVIPDGWVMVPAEPTEEMCDVGHVGVDVLTGVTDENEYYSIYGKYAAKVYRAMIAAAPQQEVKP
ncbi:hypothetical protein [Enterobacter quasiroggenkampii]|uniref:hypothetical protein n=1 Tax=Enterobacter quasiroggenkampii TaxID=2497436 RepID=UPI00065159E7|nr:hypothetical protein [Enterobacter quasiroggenkampii]